MHPNTYQAWSKRRIEERRPKGPSNTFLFTAVVIGAGSDSERALNSLHSLAQQDYQNIEIVVLDTDRIDNLDMGAFDVMRGLRFEPNVTPQDLLNSQIHDALWRGDYISFIRAGTTFDRDCFALINRALGQDTSGQADLAVVDHDYTDPVSSHVTPVFVPFWDPDLVASSDIVDLAFVASRGLVSSIRTLQECASCHDWLQGVANKKAQPIIAHVSEPVMHMIGDAPQIAKWKPVSPLPWDALDSSEWPGMAIVIPDHQTLADLKNCTGFLEQPCKFRPELIIVDTQSEDPEKQSFYAELTARFGAKIVGAGPVSNHARRVNAGVAAAQSDIVMLLQASVCFALPGQIEQLILQAMRPEVGVVGTTLCNEDGSIRQAGIVIAETDDTELVIGDVLKGADPDQHNALFAIHTIRNHQAVSGACQVMRRDVFERAGGYDEVKFPFEYCDVDFCLRVHRTGFRILNMPLHQVHQRDTAPLSDRKSIPSDDHIQKQAMSFLKERWHASTKCSVFCNPWVKIVNRPVPTPPWISEQEDQIARSKSTTIFSKTKMSSEGIANLRWAIRHPRRAAIRALKLPEKWHARNPEAPCGGKDDIAHLRPGLGAYGYFLSEIGLGQSARNLVNAADKTGFPISALNIPLTPDRQNDREFRTKLESSHSHAANMLVLDVLETRKAKDLLAPGRFNILYPYWELSTVPSNCIDSIALFDEIWAPSSFIANAMEKDFAGSVQLVPQSVRLPDTMPPPRENRNSLRLFTFFDFDSFGARKNPQAAISAFQMAFPKSWSDVELVIKARGKHDKGLRRWIADIARKDTRIRFIDRTLSRKAVDQLMADCDVFVSLHRSEGFGFGAAEALATGKAVVATDYGGTTDFITQATGYPVPFQLRPVKKGEYVETDGQVWADASHEAAAAALRSIYDSTTEAALRTESGFNLLKTNHSPDQVGAVMKKLLAQRGL